MSRISSYSVVLWGLMLAFIGCSNQDTGPSAGVAVVSGFVKDASNRNPLAGVVVEGKVGTDVVAQTSTNAQGSYELRFSIDSAMTAKIAIRNFTGYRDTSEIVVSVRPNDAVLRDIDLNPKSQVVGSGGTSTGLAQTIAFLGANPAQVSVYGVGGQETSVLGFEARDSLGLPVDGAHAVTITFSILGGPNGGEYLSPTSIVTNALGRTYIAFNSGIRSGVLQVLATATVAGRTITSAPVRLVISAGFAVQSHFTIGAAKFNFPALGIMNLRDEMSVLVGDRYSNPVAENTAVYFRTSAGVIQPTVFTSRDGQGIADLISGNPAPFGQYAAQPYGDGYHWVVARTIGQGGVPVQDSIVVLWSGRSQISSVTPSTFNIANGGSQDFAFRVSDALGHPLSSGTKISVKAIVTPPSPGADVNQVLVGFGRDGEVVLEDVILPGPGATDFVFRLTDGTLDPGVPPSSVSVSITIESLNGAAYASLNGVCN